ncbi:hypothetical protein D3C86_1165350 [compost metagenome]
MTDGQGFERGLSGEQVVGKQFFRNVTRFQGNRNALQEQLGSCAVQRNAASFEGFQLQHERFQGLSSVHQLFSAGVRFVEFDHVLRGFFEGFLEIAAGVVGHNGQLGSTGIVEVVGRQFHGDCFARLYRVIHQGLAEIHN